MAEQITEIFPDPDLLLKLAPADLAPVVLRLARSYRERPHLVHSADVMSQMHGPPGQHEKGYRQEKKAAVENAINAAWHWLRTQGLLIPESGQNGNNGWHQLNSQAEEIAAGANIDSFVQAAAFPKALLHPLIAEDVHINLARGDYDDAVLKAMRPVEEAVRQACGYSGGELGVKMMRKAFDPDNGPLTDKNEIAGERQAVSDLFAGSIGYFKNPQSHRSVGIEPETAREVAVLASLLLRIVDQRKP